MSDIHHVADDDVVPERHLHMVSEEAAPTSEVTAAHLQDLLVDHPDVRSFLQEVAGFTAATLSVGGTTYCGITLQQSRNERLTVGFSHERARSMDEVQYAHDDGPCLHALRADEEVFIPDTSAEQRWPDFMRQIMDNGIGAMFCLPLQLEGRARAALNLYAEDSAVFTGEFRQVARAFSGQASQALKLCVRVAQHAATAEDLQAVLQSRTEIDLAVGIIMGQDKCSQQAAFEKLRRASNARNVKLRDVATGMVEGYNGSHHQAHFDRS